MDDIQTYGCNVTLLLSTEVFCRTTYLCSLSRRDPLQTQPYRPRPPWLIHRRRTTLRPRRLRPPTCHHRAPIAACRGTVERCRRAAEGCSNAAGWLVGLCSSSMGVLCPPCHPRRTLISLLSDAGAWSTAPDLEAKIWSWCARKPDLIEEAPVALSLCSIVPFVLQFCHCPGVSLLGCSIVHQHSLNFTLGVAFFFLAGATFQHKQHSRKPTTAATHHSLFRSRPHRDKPNLYRDYGIHLCIYEMNLYVS